ncbi:unnamed protein product [Rotaria sp. Silwood2]|nr:unnamed protein product [Rotaria sp. Silwood2]
MAMINDCDHNLLVWIDLEMSGLDLNMHTIVEIAIAITDFHLKNYIEGPDIVIHHDQDILDKMNDWSREQHTKSGLIELIRQSQISLYNAETTVIDFLKRYCASGTGILAGNSVFVDRWQVFLSCRKIYQNIYIYDQCYQIQRSYIQNWMIFFSNDIFDETLS